MPEATARRLLSPREGVQLACDDAAGHLLFIDGWRHYRIASSIPALREAAEALAAGEADEDELRDAVRDSAGILAEAELNYHLMRLADGGYLTETLWIGEHPLASRIPPRTDPAEDAELADRYQISRFAILRREGAELVVDTPVSGTEVQIHDHRVVTLLAVLAQPKKVPELIADGAFSAEWVIPTLRFLLETETVTTLGHDQEESPVVRQWEAHDLWFQFHSRRRTRTRSYGASYRFRGDIPPLPAVKAPMSEERIGLPSPDLASLSKSDLPFVEVLEGRRSIRAHSERPITVTELGELLFRAARVRQTLQVEPYEITSRPHPSGGACYPLEIYPLVHSCDGLRPGLYHYEPEQHALSALEAPVEALDELLVDAALGTGEETRPQVLLILAARFQRVSWKYESMALATILKDVGVLYQTFYLAATAMGLAPSALGGGNPDLFARATGLHPLVESSVGEFVLGRPAE